MPEPIELPLDSDGGHLVEPPIIDSLIRDEARGEWAISFVPEENISPREKEQVTVPFGSVEGKRIALRVRRLESLLNRSPIDRIFHAGDGNFSFQNRAGDIVHLADPHGHIDLSVRAYIELADMAMTAQLAFLATSSSPT